MRHVALIIETSIAYGRGVLAGISKYNRRHGGWLTYFHPRGFGDPLPAWLRDWRGDGIIGGIGVTVPADLLASFGVPVVNLRARSDPRFPSVCANHSMVAEAAAQHLLDRGLKNFGYCGKGFAGHAWFDQRGEAFCRAVQRAGYHCHMFTLSPEQARNAVSLEMVGLEDWIRSLPKPVGVMTCNDVRGLYVLDACRRVGVHVPDEVAVVGVDNDQPLCELSIPPLSSVDVNAEQIGYEAAALLDRLMNGVKPPKKPIEVAPRGVVTRRSTDVLASEDEEVNRAVRFIREHACNSGGLRVEQVLAHVGLSRPLLQQRMKRVLGRTIHQEIVRVRINAARELLMVPEMTIKEIASRTGFSSVQHLTNAFRTAVGETPARYRDRRITPA
ncbi:XylR family transcriptional regulator [Fontivita pretiosa]|uniref:XylR family transcriptional regulator n=1 Tax=Fontivita pretiosa TaxID=2989684 RepID=UPI003D178300